MLYLAIFLVMLPVILPMGAREIADLLRKEGLQFTLAMKIVYIVFVTMCCAAFVPAGVYVAKEWDATLAIFYFIMGFLLIAIPIVHEDDHQDEDELTDRPT
jgi:uncharacterized membrane protein (DUF485 family)